MDMVQFKKVTRENFFECLNLNVTDEQKKFVAPNVFSIAQAYVNEEWSPLSIYYEDDMIGFCMFGIDPDDHRVWISRFMIDKSYQRKGYGRLAIIKLMGIIKQKYQCNQIVLSIEPENKVAQKLYESVGFINTGVIIEDELVFEKNFNNLE